MRILAIGSRQWIHYDPRLKEIYAVLVTLPRPADGHVLVHGDRLDSPDTYTSNWWKANGGEDEPHPADFDKYGPGAGDVQVSDMIKAGADLCVAFMAPCDQGGKCWSWNPHWSHRTANCVKAADAAGIEVRRFWVIEPR